MQTLREFVFLGLANHLPRLRFSDKWRWLLLKAAGFDMQGRSTVYGPVVLSPIGGASNVRIGKGCFINTKSASPARKHQSLLVNDVVSAPGSALKGLSTVFISTRKVAVAQPARRSPLVMMCGSVPGQLLLQVWRSARAALLLPVRL